MGSVANCNPAPRAAAEFKNIKYQSLSGVADNLQSLDIYAPALSNPCSGVPVIIWVHGGGWMIGDKLNLNSKAEFYRSLGYILVSVNYRLSPDVRVDPSLSESRIKFPDHPNDVGAAVAWVHKNISGYGGNPSARQVLIYRNAFGDSTDVRNLASPKNHVSKESPAFQFARRGDMARKDILSAFSASLQTLGVVTSTIEASALTHEEVNASIGAAGDTVMTPYVRDFMTRVCFPN
ncbi:alpha/beta hydrolase [bacterium]|nr:alpha/beta hydrolase [bacterium]